tara:strand:- start:424 stop:735 length:312 start_codon:yes stop_codon:yes gene_type:complete
MKLNLEGLRAMIKEELDQMTNDTETLNEVFTSAGGIGFGDMKPLVQDTPQQQSLSPRRPRIIQNDSEHAVKELYEAAVHVARLHGVDPRESLLLAAEEFPAQK